MPVLDHVSFDAPFPEDHDADGAPPGRPLAAAIRAGLAHRGVRCSDVDGLDYAYSFTAEAEGTPALVMVGHVGDDDGRQWLVFVDGGKSGLLRRKPVDVTSVVRPLHLVLVDDLHTDPQWFTEQQWNDPSFGRGQPAPTD